MAPGPALPPAIHGESGGGYLSLTHNIVCMSDKLWSQLPHTPTLKVGSPAPPPPALLCCPGEGQGLLSCSHDTLRASSCPPQVVRAKRRGGNLSFASATEAQQTRGKTGSPTLTLLGLSQLQHPHLNCAAQATSRANSPLVLQLVRSRTSSPDLMISGPGLLPAAGGEEQEGEKISHPHSRHHTGDDWQGQFYHAQTLRAG